MKSDPPPRVARRGCPRRPSGGAGLGDTTPTNPEAMTVAHRTEALAAPSLTAAVVALRARGMRVSATRRALLAALYGADDPQPAEQLGAGLDTASVYRNLDALEAVGLVRHLHAGHGPGRYVLAARDGGYAACERCGRHARLDSGTLRSLRSAVLAHTGFVADFRHFPIVGRCPGCALDPYPAEEPNAHP